jgi:glycosyltransferase involved in cell wall biosynthesis
LVRELANGLIARGHRPRLITAHPGPRSETIEDGLPITRNRRPPDGWLPLPGHEDFLTQVPFSYRGLMRGDDDLAHAVFATEALAAVRWARRRGRPAVYTHLGIPDDSDLDERRWRRWLVERAVRGCSAFTVLSQAAARAARESLGVEPRVIFPGVDLESFQPGPPRFQQPTIICAAGIDQPRKRVGLLVEAFRLLRRRRPDARLLLSRPTGLERLRPTGGPAQGVGQGDGVEYFDEFADLPNLYARSWVSVLPAEDEAFGLVLAEALACGTPVVGSALGGIPEVIDRPHIGRVVPSLEPGELATGILETLDMAKEPGTRQVCRERAGEFSTERATAAYEALYTELLADTAFDA